MCPRISLSAAYHAGRRITTLARIAHCSSCFSASARSPPCRWACARPSCSCRWTRFQYDEQQNILSINFEQFEVKSLATIAAIGEQVRSICEPLDHKAWAVVNGEGSVLDRELEDACAQMVKDLIARFYFLVSRFTTSTFMRAKLGEALLRREVAPHTFESGAESRAKLLRGPY